MYRSYSASASESVHTYNCIGIEVIETRLIYLTSFMLVWWCISIFNFAFGDSDILSKIEVAEDMENLAISRT